MCECAPCRNFRHDDIAEVYADILEDTGASARREVFVPEFSTGSRDAFIDTWGFGTAELPDSLIDVTVRYPLADQYQPTASQTAGSAEEQAAKETLETYPPSNRRSVTTAAHETWGRLGQEAEEFLLH